MKFWGNNYWAVDGNLVFYMRWDKIYHCWKSGATVFFRSVDRWYKYRDLMSIHCSTMQAAAAQWAVRNFLNTGPLVAILFAAAIAAHQSRSRYF
ncbi:MAG: hypothetical protein IPL35_04765 [Sphingobacteriales bacterium]|nr:hypothetical protein [Sphingobacteriales bacterium]